jgi:mannose-1-phosphate guanylyltransferase
MFVWRRRAIRGALEAFAPDILEAVGGGLTRGRLKAAYDAVRATSIDFAVMEPAAAAGAVVMAAMDVGWSDLGGWTALLDALGGRSAGRVVQPGEAVDVEPDDVVVRRCAGRLVVELDQPAGILDASGPSALLRGARSERAIVEALVARCSPSETRP